MKKITSYSVLVKTNAKDFPDAETKKYFFAVPIDSIKADINQRFISFANLTHLVHVNPPVMP